jgi:peptidoglycan/xylan/chitin deacetylase (PgdA/CDA1 family)
MIDLLGDPDGWLTPIERRAVLVGGAAILATLTGCASVLTDRPSTNDHTTAGKLLVGAAAAPAAETATPAPPVYPIPPPRSGPPIFISRGPDGTRTFALTIDDGTSAEVVARYVAFAVQTGFALTFFPNGSIRRNWEAQVEALRPLVERGQVQIGNHTWSHLDLLRMTDSAIRTDLERNEEWIQKTFGITSRPWLRPPYGNRNVHTDGVAASLGFTHIVNWSGTFGDSSVKTPSQILGAADLYGNPGAIVLGHANHPAVTRLFDQLRATFAAKGLTSVTLDQMFGTSRRVG